MYAKLECVFLLKTTTDAQTICSFSGIDFIYCLQKP